ncbi:sulfurtransferase-like selenium metabolism protein YedF [Bacillota bacterium]
MGKEIDARGKACPIPVIMAKKEADGGSKEFTILVDNKTAVENLTRFANSSGFGAAAEERPGGDFSVRFKASKTEDGSLPSASPVPGQDGEASHFSKGSWAIFIGSEGIGRGDLELGSSLMKMYFYTLEEGKDLPSYVLFMNDGVKVPVRNEQAIGHLKALEARGSKILVCGTCLKYYGLSDDLGAGIVSNMYDISEAMMKVDKVITL